MALWASGNSSRMFRQGSALPLQPVSGSRRVRPAGSNSNSQTSSKARPPRPACTSRRRILATGTGEPAGKRVPGLRAGMRATFCWLAIGTSRQRFHPDFTRSPRRSADRASSDRDMGTGGPLTMAAARVFSSPGRASRPGTGRLPLKPRRPIPIYEAGFPSVEKTSPGRDAGVSARSRRPDARRLRS